MMKTKVFLLLLLAPLTLFAQTVNFPGGRIAFSVDGNQHDKDDWGATAVSLSMLDAAGLNDKLVHYDHSNHLGQNNSNWEAQMVESAEGGCTRFGLDVSKVYNDQDELAEAVANFAAEANKSSASDPLWFICAGPMEVAYQCLAAVNADKLQYIYCISHSTWNENHNDTPQMSHQWSDMKSDFPSVTFHDIIDQNKSNGDRDFNTPNSDWFWLRDSDNPDWQWLYSRDDKNSYDVSDAGMTWWLITGGPNGGCDNCGWPEYKALMENPVSKVTDFHAFEAESTSSALGEWIKISDGDANYVADASGEEHIEFTGNGPNGGGATSPLAYTFTCSEAGTYRLLMRARKRLEGQPGDKCNDCYVKMAGDFESGNDIPVADLKSNEKFFGGNADNWGWAKKLDWQGHIKRDALYTLKEGEEYTFTISGRSIRFNIDYIVLYNTAKYSEAEAIENCKPGAGGTNNCDKMYTTDWNLDIPGYSAVGSLDNSRNAIQINTNQQPTNEWAAATGIFKGTAGTYDVIFTSLTETDGESSYKVYVDGAKIFEYQNPRIHGTPTPDYSEWKVGTRDIVISDSAELKIEFLSNSNGLVEEGSGYAYARARWRSITFGNCEEDDVDLWISNDPNDLDGDGVVNDSDNCVYKYNPDQLDMDGDNIGDVCDDDKDGDGFDNDVDVCPDTANADQVDTDGDGLGDICDPLPNLACTKAPTLIDLGNGAEAGQTAYQAHNLPADKVYAVYYDNGGEGVAYHDTDPARNWATFRTEEGVDCIDKNSDGIAETGGTAVGEWLEYTLNFTEGGTYQFKASTASTSTGKFFLKLDGEILSCLYEMPGTSDLKTYATHIYDGVFNIPAGEHVLTIVLESESLNIDYFEFVDPITDASNIVNESKPKVVPNPFTDRFEILFDGNIDNALISMYDITGKQFHIHPIQSAANGFEIDASNLTNGLYFIQIIQGNKSDIIEVIKQ